MQCKGPSPTRSWGCRWVRKTDGGTRPTLQWPMSSPRMAAQKGLADCCCVGDADEEYEAASAMSTQNCVLERPLPRRRRAAPHFRFTTPHYNPALRQSDPSDGCIRPLKGPLKRPFKGLNLARWPRILGFQYVKHWATTKESKLLGFSSWKL